MRVASPFPFAFLVVCLGPLGGAAQDIPNTSVELSRLTRELQETRSALTESQHQIQELRQDLEELRRNVQGYRSAQSPPPNEQSPSPEPSVSAADQDVGFLAAKVSELHQDKVESASKYPVKISGLVLFNSYVNGGSVASADLPVLAFPRAPRSPNGSIGATLSQTLMGIDVTGPALLGARTSADAAIDFAGGSPTTPYGVTAGLIRLRTANARLDWASTSLKIGQDSPFFSPLSPTSYATVEQPALSWAGNLWVWTPGIELEHHLALTPNSSIVLQGGLLDPLTEDVPPFQGRTATAGELSRVPAIAGRVAWDRHSAAYHPFTIGIGSYRARQQYQTFPKIDSWTMNADFDASITKFLDISGEWYKGQAVGGLGGGISTSVVYSDTTEPHGSIHALRSTGGWGQVKLKPTMRFEINAALGQDENYGKDLRFFSVPYTDYGLPAFQKNRAGFLNFIYKPRTSLLFALEYRRLFTAPAVGPSASGDQVNLAAGVQF